MEIVKVYKESLPPVKLAGRRYTHRDRDENGAFASHWQQWFREGWFDTLQQGGAVPGVSGDYLGAMRGDGEAFEYWIGVFLPPDAAVPDGFDAVAFPAGELGVCWLYGSGQSGELFGMEAYRLSTAAFAGQGWNLSPSGWFMERYNCPRFTKPDEKGNVILDLCACLA